MSFVQFTTSPSNTRLTYYLSKLHLIRSTNQTQINTTRGTISCINHSLCLIVPSLQRKPLPPSHRHTSSTSTNHPTPRLSTPSDHTTSFPAKPTKQDRIVDFLPTYRTPAQEDISKTYPSNLTSATRKGTMTCKYQPIGFEKVNQNKNLRIHQYKSLHNSPPIPPRKIPDVNSVLRRTG